MVLYFDTAATSEADLARAVTAAQQFVRTQTQPEDLLAIMCFSDGTLRVKQDFTGDRDQLLQILRQLIDGKDRDSSAVTGGDSALVGLQTAIQKLGSLDGRKALIYFNIPAGPNAPDSRAQLPSALVRLGVGIAAQRANVHCT